VIGGYFDQEFSKDSKILFELFNKGVITAVISSVTMEELEEAPPEVRNLVLNLPEHSVEIIRETEQSADLADLYVKAGAVPNHSYDDARHIALATIQRVDVLVSWNFKHIVNFNRIHAYNSVNIREGYFELEIRSPKEVISDGNQSS
jgi:hypothetical protein